MRCDYCKARSSLVKDAVRTYWLAAAKWRGGDNLAWNFLVWPGVWLVQCALVIITLQFWYWFIMSSSPNDSRQSAPVSLAFMRRLFARPARIHGSQFFRREISGRMFERLALIRANPRMLLDAGCGEGDDLLALHQAFPGSALLGVDASVDMLDALRRRAVQSKSAMRRLLVGLLGQGRSGPDVALLACADFSRLPLPQSSVDLVWSNLALHWHPQPDRVFAEWRRVLRADGLLMFSCFGPDTFRQLRHAFNAIGQEHAVLPFVDLHDFGDMLVETGFSTPVMDMETLNITYSSTDKLLDDVRAFGGNPLLTRQSGMTGRRHWQAFLDALESQRGPDGKLMLTMEIVYGHAFRPASRSLASGESIIRLDLNRH